MPAATRRSGFSLVETLVAMAIIAVVFVSFYAGITSGVGIIQLSRENLRATQIIVERMETMRLCSWEQVISGTNIPPTFTERYYPVGPDSGQGLMYYGTLVITNASTGNSYEADMRRVVVTLVWTNGSVRRSREMQTMVAKNGMQNYVF